MRDQHTAPVRAFRWAVFLLAAFYVLRQFVFAADYGDPGGPFRYLTHWALLLTFFTASRMLALSEYRSDRDWGMLVGVTAVTNALVVFLYWRLFLQDPALVTTATPIWWVEYYVHLLGPLLQWADALLIFGGFRHFWKSLGGLAVLVSSYVAWIELFVGPNNAAPVGRVTSGLPYPFLNNLVAGDRLGFYLTTAMSVVAFLVVFQGAVLAARAVLGRHA